MASSGLSCSIPTARLQLPQSSPRTVLESWQWSTCSTTFFWHTAHPPPWDSSIFSYVSGVIPYLRIRSWARFLGFLYGNAASLFDHTQGPELVLSRDAILRGPMVGEPHQRKACVVTSQKGLPETSSGASTLGFFRRRTVKASGRMLRNSFPSRPSRGSRRPRTIT
jgi:hypothetical protein